MVLSRFINSEASANAHIATDIDNYRNRYMEADKELNLSVIFPGFSMEPIEKNLYLLYSNSTKVPWDDEWKMRPDYCSFKQYGTVIYWWIILYVNKQYSLMDFDNLDEVIVPNIRTIQKLALDKVSRSDFSEDEIPNYNPTKYYKRYPMDEIEMDTRRGAELLVTTNTPYTPDCTLVEKVDSFTLTAANISNKFVDLTYTPVNYSSIEFKIDDYTSVQRYGYDYILKYITGTTTQKRISWSDDDCTLGNGLEHLLVAGDIINITYIYTQIGCYDCCSSSGDCVDGGVFT